MHLLVRPLLLRSIEACETVIPRLETSYIKSPEMKVFPSCLLHARCSEVHRKRISEFIGKSITKRAYGKKGVNTGPHHASARLLRRIKTSGRQAAYVRNASALCLMVVRMETISWICGSVNMPAMP